MIDGDVITRFYGATGFAVPGLAGGAGFKTEWSLACPAIGIEFDC